MDSRPAEEWREKLFLQFLDECVDFMQVLQNHVNSVRSEQTSREHAVQWRGVTKYTQVLCRVH